MTMMIAMKNVRLPSRITRWKTPQNFCRKLFIMRLATRSYQRFFALKVLPLFLLTIEVVRAADLQTITMTIALHLYIGARAVL